MRNRKRAIMLFLLSCTVYMGIKCPVAFCDQPRFDVNDVSYLWPVPKTKEDVDGLISANAKLLDGSSQIWPQAAFDTLIKTAVSVKVTSSAGIDFGIGFSQFANEFALPANWKVTAIRIDPSAPGSEVKAIAIFGSAPQIRLIMQPVTVSAAGIVQVHDYTAHLVFSFIKGTEPSTIPNGPPRFIPDKDKFAAIVGDIKKLKADLESTGISTT
jgi:hypothetical protein